MLRTLLALALLYSTAVFAQTTIDITVPGNTVCSYVTGPVTNGSTAGHLQATATSSSGTGCGTSGGSVTFGPAQALAPAATTLPNAGGTVNFSFQAVNATTQCTGSITGASGGAFTAGSTLCTASGCNSLVSAPATFPTNSSSTADAVYNVSVTCTGSAGSATSNATVTVPKVGTPVSGGCPNGQGPAITSTTTGISAFNQWTGTHPVAIDSGLFNTKQANVASFDSVYGTWPGQYGLIIYFLLPTNSYLSMAFNVPNNYMTAANAPNPLYGAYSVGETGNKANESITISTSCGDFSNPATYPTTSTVVPGCWKNKLLTGGLLQWHNSGATCVLQNNKTYYLNIINADISLVQPGGAGTAASTKTSGCTSGTCELPIEDGPGTWGGYTPQ